MMCSYIKMNGDTYREATLSFSFLAHLYKCTGRAVALPTASVLAMAMALTKC